MLLEVAPKLAGMPLKRGGRLRGRARCSAGPAVPRRTAPAAFLAVNQRPLHQAIAVVEKKVEDEQDQLVSVRPSPHRGL